MSPDSARTDVDDQRDQAAMLLAEGALVNGLPDKARELSSDDLQALIDQ